MSAVNAPIMPKRNTTARPIKGQISVKRNVCNPQDIGFSEPTERLVFGLTRLELITRVPLHLLVVVQVATLDATDEHSVLCDALGDALVEHRYEGAVFREDEVRTDEGLRAKRDIFDKQHRISSN